MIRREEGAISLAAALIVPLILLFLAYIFRFAVLARADWETVRLAAAGVEAELSGYSRELFDTFGLFAAPMDGSRAKSATGGMTRLAHTVQSVVGDDTLSAPGKMKSEIIRHMKLRAPLTMLSDILRRTSRIWGERHTVLPDGSVESAIKNVTGKHDTRGFLPGAIDLPAGEAREQLEALIEAEISSIYESVVTDMMPADTYDPGEASTLDFFDPHNLAAIGSQIDRLFHIGEYGVLERLYFAEYALAYFHQTTPVIYVQTTRVEFRTPDGRSINEFPRSRRFEVEQMIMGGYAEKAKRRTHNAIRGIRTVIHLTANFADQGKRAVYMSKAATLSSAIFIASVGTVSIPPESLLFLFMLRDAVSAAKSDVAKLTRGFGVRFWPNAALELYYPDYLRLMLLLRTPDQLAEAIYRQINTVCPGSHYTSVEVSVEAANRQVTLNGRFRTRDEE